jgi:hypothetical protein
MARKKDPKYKKIDLINKIVQMSCNGISQPEVIQWLQSEGECQISYTYELLREAKPIILDTLRDISKDRLETTIRELEQMYLDAKLSDDKKLALDIKKEINKIAGLHNQKIDITTGGEKLNQISVIKLIEYKKNEDDDKTEKE